MNTKTKTAEECKAQTEALHASIIQQVQQLADSGQWQAFLDFARSFHSYSLNNLLLILAQEPNATMVAGFRQWQTKGRQVRKGEKAIKIFGYSQKKTTQDQDEDSTAEADQRIIRYFPVLSVFDITQTDPIEGAEPIPVNPTRALTGSEDHGVLAPLTAHLESAGWTISREPLTHANGYTDPDTHRIILNTRISAEQSAKTLIHEAAHIHLGHTDNIDQYRQHRGRMEVEAESVAYILAGLSGFDTSNYSIGYITGWANQDTNLIRETASRVLTTSATLADVLS